MISRALVALLALCLLGTARGVALAEPSSPARARCLLPACSPQPVDVDDLLAVLRVELLGAGTTLGELRGEEQGPQALFLIDSPSCRAEDIVVRLEHSATGRAASVAFNLADRPETERGRVLALALAELLRARWAELSRPAEPPPGEAEPAPEVARPRLPPPGALDLAARERALLREALARSVGEPRVGRARQPRLLIGAVIATDLYPGQSGVLFGGRLRLSFAPVRRGWLHLALDGGYGRGGGSARRGAVVTQAATCGLGLSFSGGTRGLRGELGPRLELGRGWTRGEPTTPGSGSGSGDGLLLTLSARASARVLLGHRLWLTAGLSLGYVLVGLVALSELREVGGVAGPAVGLELGLSVGIWPPP